MHLRWKSYSSLNMNFAHECGENATLQVLLSLLRKTAYSRVTFTCAFRPLRTVRFAVSSRSFCLRAPTTWSSVLSPMSFSSLCLSHTPPRSTDRLDSRPRAGPRGGNSTLTWCMKTNFDVWWSESVFAPEHPVLLQCVKHLNFDASWLKVETQREIGSWLGTAGIQADELKLKLGH